MVEAARHLDVAPETIRVQARKGRIKARRRLVIETREILRYQREQSHRFGVRSLAHPRHPGHVDVWGLRQILEDTTLGDRLKEDAARLEKLAAITPPVPISVDHARKRKQFVKMHTKALLA